jgi:AraC-like DNA-binding protein
MPGNFLAPPLRARALEMRKSGHNAQQIAYALAITKSEVNELLKDEFGDDLHAQIVKLRQQGLTYKEIRAITECAMNTIHRACAEAGLVQYKGPYRAPTKLSHQQKLIVRYKYAAGARADDIAEQYEVKPSYIYSIVKGLTNENYTTRLTKKQIYAVRRLANQTWMSPMEISLRVGVSLASVYKYRHWDPMREHDRIPEDRRWNFVRKNVPRDPDRKADIYWRCWELYWEHKIPARLIAKHMDLPQVFVQGAIHCHNQYAYRALWELKRKRERGIDPEDPEEPAEDEPT